MQQVVLFGVGSPIVVDVEESLARSNVSIAAAVRNLDCDVQLLDDVRVITPLELTAEDKATPFLVPLFTPGNRQHAVNEARRCGFINTFSLIDATVAVPRAFDAQAGVYINSGCSLGAASQLGEFVFINRGVSLGHHAQLGRFVSIGPGAVLGSLVDVGHGALIGAGAVVLPKLRIGSNAVVGAGSVVTKDVPPHTLVVGNPARVVQNKIAGYGNRRVA